MPKWVRIMAFTLAMMIAFCSCAFADTIPEPTLSPEAVDYDSTHPENLQEEQLYAASAILIEADTGEIIFSKDADAVRYPASTTKIMTLMLGLLLVDESRLDEIVVVSDRAVDVPEDSSTMNLKAGEEISYRDLLYGTMLSSANDGCNAIAEFSAGSIENFVYLMNQKAAELGCTNTHFSNLHGYHDDDHYTTAHDMAIITREAMKIPLFRDIVSQSSYKVGKTNLSRARNITSTNRLLFQTWRNEEYKYYYADAIGIKTGQHSMAGYCFVGGAERGGVTLISVVFFTGNRARWADTIKLMEYGFSQYTSVTPLELYNMNPLSIETSGFALDDPYMGKLELKCVATDSRGSSVHIVATNTEIQSMAVNIRKTCQITYTRDFYAPISSGDVIGTMTYYPDDGDEVVYNLVASRDVKKRENAPKSLAEIKEEVENDPNPRPPVTLELIVTWIVLPVATLLLLKKLIGWIHRKRRRRKRMSKLRIQRHIR